MSLQCASTPLPGVLCFTPRVFEDARGFFKELLHAEKYRAYGVPRAMVQSNLSRSQCGTLRGLHWQLRRPQAKLVMALRGTIWDIAVDVRRGSPTYGRWYGEELSETNHRQLYIPAGFAHGFHVLSETADVLYYCDDYYAPEDECGIAWNDPGLGVDWRLAGEPVLSPRDRGLPPLAELNPERLPVYAP
jgi:dTDP-4-dehydrorhamnose 3,5-epimerase